MLQFTLETTPTPQQRARHARNGRAYKSGTQVGNENTLDALLAEHKPQTPIIGPVVLEFTAYMPIAASATKKDKEAKLRGEIHHTSKPDLDNLAKQLKDAMTRMQFWGDDRQVVELRCRKAYAERGAWCVEVRSAV